MIAGSGYGMFLVMGVYVASFFILSKSELLERSRAEQIMAILIACTLTTSVNYFLAKWLNRNGCKHTVYDVRLENAVLVCGSVLMFLALLMLWGEVKD